MRIYTFAVGLIGATLALEIAPNRVWAIELASPATVQSENAADLYRQAVTSMEKIPPRGRKALDDANEDKLSLETPAALALQKGTIALVRDAAHAARCDWGNIGLMQQELGSLNSLRGLVNLMVVQMRYDFKQHDHAKALDDFFAATTLARNIGRQPLLITKLVEIGSEAVAMKWFAHDLPAIPKDQLKDFPARFEKLPRATFADLMAGEKTFATSEAQRQGGMMPIMVQGLDPFYKALGDAGDLSPEEFATVVDTEAAKLKLNPLVGTLAPSFKRTQMTMAKIRAQEEMLKTAVAIHASDESAVAQSKDPYGTGPFAYRKTPGGFELTSALQTDGKPVTLLIGH